MIFYVKAVLFDFAFQMPRNQAKPWFWSKAELNLPKAGWLSLGCQTENIFSWQIFRNTHLPSRPSHKSWEDSAAQKAPPSSGPCATRLCLPGSCQVSSSGWQESAALSTYQQFWGLEEIHCLGASLVFSLQIWVARGVVSASHRAWWRRSFITICCLLPS